mgnify:CR=1 FL=1
MSKIKNIYSRLRFETGKFIKKDSYEKDETVQDIVNQLKEHGFAAIPNFYSKEECEFLRNEVDRIIDDSQSEGHLWVDEVGADNRVHAAHELSVKINEFNKNKLLQSVADNYFKGKMQIANTLAARIRYAKSNIGSGGGWHRDGNFFQFKAIIYLSDVTEKNGPFQIIDRSHKLSQVIEDTEIMGKEGLDVRMTDSDINKIVEKEPDRYKMLTAKEGTLLFADTSAIHTGKPIEEGHRYALFNYFYPSYDNIDKRRDFFKNAHKLSSEYE